MDHNDNMNHTSGMNQLHSSVIHGLFRKDTDGYIGVFMTLYLQLLMLTLYQAYRMRKFKRGTTKSYLRSFLLAFMAVLRIILMGIAVEVGLMNINQSVLHLLDYMALNAIFLQYSLFLYDIGMASVKAKMEDTQEIVSKFSKSLRFFLILINVIFFAANLIFSFIKDDFDRAIGHNAIIYSFFGIISTWILYYCQRIRNQITSLSVENSNSVARFTKHVYVNTIAQWCLSMCLILTLVIANGTENASSRSQWGFEIIWRIVEIGLGVIFLRMGPGGVLARAPQNKSDNIRHSTISRAVSGSPRNSVQVLPHSPSHRRRSTRGYSVSGFNTTAEDFHQRNRSWSSYGSRSRSPSASPTGSIRRLSRGSLHSPSMSFISPQVRRLSAAPSFAFPSPSSPAPSPSSPAPSPTPSPTHSLSPPSPPSPASSNASRSTSSNASRSRARVHGVHSTYTPSSEVPTVDWDISGATESKSSIHSTTGSDHSKNGVHSSTGSDHSKKGVHSSTASTITITLTNQSGVHSSLNPSGAHSPLNRSGAHSSQNRSGVHSTSESVKKPSVSTRLQNQEPNPNDRSLSELERVLNKRKKEIHKDLEESESESETKVPLTIIIPLDRESPDLHEV